MVGHRCGVCADHCVSARTGEVEVVLQDARILLRHPCGGCGNSLLQWRSDRKTIRRFNPDHRARRRRVLLRLVETNTWPDG